MKKGKHVMEFISDKTIFRAVMFARTMMRSGTAPGLANYRAAEFYGVKTQDVAHYTGQTGARSKGQKK